MLDFAGLDDLNNALIRSDYRLWCEHALRASGFKPALHHLRLIKELDEIANGTNDRLMISMPPGSAKSTYASELFPPYFMARHPGAPIIGASHTSELAEKFSRKIQARIRENSGVLGYGLERENVQNWTTTEGSEYLATGMGTGVPSGVRALLAVVDDPLKSFKVADTDKGRDTIWDSFQADLLGRMKPGGRIVIIMTRWHPDDLIGRLLQVEPERWRVIKFPAIAEANDDLGRRVGEPLWSDGNYGYGQELEGKRNGFHNAGTMRVWYSTYQQEPRNAEGNLFLVGKIGIDEAAFAGGREVRGWDLAATAQGGDWTCGVKVKLVDGRVQVTDVVRVQGGPEEVQKLIVTTAQTDGRAVTVSLPQDPGQAGKQQVFWLTQKLQGYTVKSSPETGDKATRAGPIAAQCNVGNMSLVQDTPGNKWNVSFKGELLDFPAGKYDDQADALSRAYNELTAIPAPAKRMMMNHMAR